MPDLKVTITNFNGLIVETPHILSVDVDQDTVVIHFNKHEEPRVLSTDEVKSVLVEWMK